VVQAPDKITLPRSARDGRVQRRIQDPRSLLERCQVTKVAQELKAAYVAREVDLAEAPKHLGLDAIWITEHLFTGETVYGDAVVFTAALAVKTQRILLGLGVVEMALHNPVQLAIQTALLDNLSRGRLIVDTGRGSNYNAYEYIGFGTDILEGQKRLPEAEDLLLKAWTTETLEYHGAY